MTWPEGTLNDAIAANYSASGAGAGSISYPGTGAGYMDRVDPGSTINAFAGDSAGFGLRPRNPSNTRELILETPSTGFEKLTVKFASMRSSSGAVQEELYYSSNGGTDWVKVGSAYDIPLDWELKSFDLSDVAAVNNNKDLKFKILFVGTGADGASGNNRFDNITIEGTKVN
jgi:hypothetical protein